jgi:hypothetical protein
MIFSKEQTFSEKQAITGNAVSTNVIDLGTPGTVLKAPAALVRDIGKGRPIPIAIQVTADFNTLDSLTVGVQTSNAEGFGGSPVTVASTVLPLAALTAGKKYALQFVPLDVKQRYVRLTYTVGGSNPSTGSITAGIVKAVQTNDTVPGADL